MEITWERINTHFNNQIENLDGLAKKQSESQYLTHESVFTIDTLEAKMVNERVSAELSQILKFANEKSAEKEKIDHIIKVADHHVKAYLSKLCQYRSGQSRSYDYEYGVQLSILKEINQILRRYQSESIKDSLSELRIRF